METVQLPGRPAPWHLGQGYGHSERIFDVSFHPLNEDIVVTASEDTSVRMWRRAEGSTMYKQVRAYLGHSGEVLRAGWSANGMLVASGSADRTVRLWAADLDEPSYTGRQLAVLDGHPEEVYHVELMNPGQPAPRPSERPRPGGGGAAGEGGGGAVPLPPFETHILAASCESLFVWSLQQGAVQQQADAPGTSGSTITQEAMMAGAKPAYIFAVTRQPAGTLVAAACCDGAVRLWSLRPSGHLDWAGQISLPGSPMCTGCAFADDGWRLGVTIREGRLVELDVRTLELLTSRPLPASPLTVSYLPRSAAAAAAPAAAGTAGAGAGAAEGLGGADAWLVACRDGGVYGYALDQHAGGPSCVLLAPSGRPDAAQLAVGVARGGGAVAMAGEPQDTSHLPRMRKAVPVEARAPAPAAAAAAAPTAAASTSGGGGGDVDAAKRPTVAPPRRRGAGAGAGRRVAGGLGSLDPLALFEEPGAEELSDGVAAMSLRGDATAPAAASAAAAGAAATKPEQQQAKSKPEADGAGKGDADMRGADEEEEAREAAKAAAHGRGTTGVLSQPADGAAVAAGKLRAPILVYRAAWS
ncbi:hypothetical protein HXX76_016048 [Chlamydomonas incerta]|uniref:Uncharacterized protein n=1 Tax=Chlamydomonas incerta TaxID=51695 RepID=A0A835SFD9_CHLIN|nr:hypothetical protein HXX76_016048 [Chlamydomonas incerta]|eukprot:KAG2422403.1 hypothetical protein HXX76_016048 [Chlamydomonas incerta]